MPLGMKVGLCPGHTVLGGDPAALKKIQAQPPPPLFSPCLLWPDGYPSQLLLTVVSKLIANQKCMLCLIAEKK